MVADATEEAPPWVLLVGVDFDELADAVLGEALAMARRQTSCRVYVTHIIDTSRLKHLVSPMDALRQQMREVPGRLRIRARQRGLSSDEGRDLHIQVVVGRPAEELLRMSEVLCANLVILGAGRRTGVYGVLGSVAAVIAGRAPCSRLLVGARPYTDAPSEAQIDATPQTPAPR